MSDKKNMTKRVMGDIFSSPLVLMPFMVGSMAFASLFALGLKGSMAVSAVVIGLVGTLASAGTFLTKFILGRDDRIRKLVEASRSKAKRDKRKALDHFHHRLTVDGDERTETSMQDLRSLRQAFRQLDKIAPDLNQMMVEDIQQRSDELFQQCVSSLEKTLQLWKTADSLASETARKPILDQREKLVSDVVQTVEHMSRTLASVQGITSRSDGDARLQRLRGELDQSLEVAKKVEQRVDSLLTGARVQNSQQINKT
ncbi:MAG: hypothetical protein HN707_11750 [Verrucomicrobia bacterium]|nr:hypothetical protein [Verrucomicrobiota bacterium]MBT7735572.1 hypothetical protein [Verrucomicrobiota bacterium]